MDLFFGFPTPHPCFSQGYPLPQAPALDPRAGLYPYDNDPFRNQNPTAQSMAVPLMPPQTQLHIQCTALGCRAIFKRDPDRLRHEAAVHGINQALQLYLCPIIGCPKSQGTGYTRKDKLTEHLWKKHANLGYVKRA
jgi:hypothetical protein